MINLEEVYQDYAEFVFKFLFSLCNDVDIAEELTQETFYKAIKSSSRYDGTCKISTWLCQIAKHLWYQQIEKNKRYNTQLLNKEVTLSELSIEDKQIIKAEKMELFKEVHILDEVAKEVVLLRITGVFSFKEIGELFDRNENWARVTFYRAKQKIVKGRLG